MEIFFHILNSAGVRIVSNLPSDFSFKKEEVLNTIKTIACDKTNKTYRHGYFVTEVGSVYLATCEDGITNKILRRYFDACFFFLPRLIESEKEYREKEQHNFRRLKHNLVTHNTNILQELEKYFPLDNFPKGGKQQIEYIQDTLKSNINDISISILKVIKSSNLMKSDFDVYDMLISKNPYLEFDDHNIHKIILQIINPFWLEFVQKNIYIEINDCHDFVNVDYKSISVVFTHLFENAVKYIAPKTKLRIAFENKENEICVYLGMTSLQITDKDYKNIFESDYSGELSTSLGLNGSGIGMNIVKQLLNMNNAEIEIKRNVDRKQNRNIHGVPYERNRFYINLKKAAPNSLSTVIAG